jgi:Protein of unknown function (DUF2934)
MDETKSRSQPRKAAARKVAPAKTGSKAPRKSPASGAEMAPSDRDIRVRMAAYFRAERRGFAPGHEIEDWLAAEAELNGQGQPGSAAKPRKSPVRKPRAG